MIVNADYNCVLNEIMICSGAQALCCALWEYVQVQFMLSLTGRIPGCRAREKQREKYMDGIIRAVGDESKAVQILQMTRDREMWQSMVANVCRGTALR